MSNITTKQSVLLKGLSKTVAPANAIPFREHHRSSRLVAYERSAARGGDQSPKRRKKQVKLITIDSVGNRVPFFGGLRTIVNLVDEKQPEKRPISHRRSRPVPSPTNSWFGFLLPLKIFYAMRFHAIHGR